jgi:hypothetical protein
MYGYNREMNDDEKEKKETKTRATSRKEAIADRINMCGK